MRYKLADLGVISKVNLQELNKQGIETTEDLLEKATYPGHRRDLAEKTSIEEDLILEWASLADLMRLEGVGARTAQLLSRTENVHAVHDLPGRDPNELYTEIKRVNNEAQLVQRTPSLKRIKSWVSQANGLQPMLVYFAQKGLSTEIEAGTEFIHEEERRATLLHSVLVWGSIALIGVASLAFLYFYFSSKIINPLESNAIEFSEADYRGLSNYTLLGAEMYRKWLHFILLEGALGLVGLIMFFATFDALVRWGLRYLRESMDGKLFASNVERRTFLAVSRNVLRLCTRAMLIFVIIFLVGGVSLGFAITIQGLAIETLSEPGITGRKTVIAVMTIGVLMSISIAAGTGYHIFKTLRNSLKYKSFVLRKFILSYTLKITFLIVALTVFVCLLGPICAEGVNLLHSSIYLPRMTKVCHDYDVQVQALVDQKQLSPSSFPLEHNPCSGLLFPVIVDAATMTLINRVSRGFVSVLFLIPCFGFILIPLFALEKVKVAVFLLFTLAAYGIGELIEAYLPQVYWLNKTSFLAITIVIVFMLVTEVFFDTLYKSAIEESKKCVFCGSPISAADAFCNNCGGRQHSFVTQKQTQV